MSELDWHAERGRLSSLALLDLAPESAGVDLPALRAYRLRRVREQMAARDIGALILSDAVNIRYATGTRNMQIFTTRNAPSRYLLITADQTILYEFAGCEHLAAGFETISEVRPAHTASFVAAGENIGAVEKDWAREMADTIIGEVGRETTVGVERLNAGAAVALAQHSGGSLRLVDAQAAVEMARAIKSAEEIKCIKASLRATESAVAKLQQAIRPGISENELWSVLHQSVIAANGDYCETRLLSSGQRTNPWFQETANKKIAANELVALDTDVVGCHGYYSDFSRTFHSGPAAPTAAQRELYKTAYEQVQYNMGIVRAGMRFRDYAERAWEIPQKYFANRYYVSAHGCGMTGEYPYLYHRADFAHAGYDGVLLPNMTICIESYIGEEGGCEGVKLEEQILIKEDGIETLSQYPFAADLLS